MRGQEDRAGTVREQTSQIDVALLADRPEPPMRPARAFAWGETEPTGKLPRAAKRVEVSDGRHRRGCRQKPDPRNAHQSLDDRVVLGHGVEGAFNPSDPILDIADLLH